MYRKWLSGPLAGGALSVSDVSDVQQMKSDASIEVFIEALPGMPDGITEASDGNFWLSLVAPISPDLTKIITDTPPLVRLVVSNLFFNLGIGASVVCCSA